MDAVRPRALTGLLRSRLPLTFQLRLAAQQELLLWWSPQAFVVMEPPGIKASRRGSRWLRRLDHSWELLLFIAPPFGLLIVATLFGLPDARSPQGITAARVCALSAVVYITVLMAAAAVRGFLTLYRLLILGRSRDVTESGLGQVLATHWSIRLCVLPTTTSDAGAVLDQVQRFVSDRVCGNSGGSSRTLEVFWPLNAMIPEEGCAVVLRDPRVSLFSEEPPVLITRAGGLGPLILPPPPAAIAGELLTGVPWLIGGMAVVLGVTAQFVAGWERQDCASHPVPDRVAQCADQPQTYWDALYWLLNRLLGGDPNGLGANTFYARSLGLLITLMGVVVVGGVITSLLQQAVKRTQRFGHDLVEAYNDATPRPAVGGPSTPVEMELETEQQSQRLSAGPVSYLVVGLALGAGLMAGCRLRRPVRTINRSRRS